MSDLKIICIFAAWRYGEFVFCLCSKLLYRSVLI